VEALDLDGISEGRPRAVALNEVDVAGAPTCASVSGAHRAELTLRVWRHEAAADIVREPQSSNDRVHPVLFAKRILEPLEDEDPRALADDEAVRPRVER
jgi:hypothetical protein